MNQLFATTWIVVHQAFPGKNNGVGCNFLLQGNFLTQGLNLCHLQWQVDFFFFTTVSPREAYNV